MNENDPYRNLAKKLVDAIRVLPQSSDYETISNYQREIEQLLRQVVREAAKPAK